MSKNKNKKRGNPVTFLLVVVLLVLVLLLSRLADQPYAIVGHKAVFLGTRTTNVTILCSSPRTCTSSTEHEGTFEIEGIFNEATGKVAITIEYADVTLTSGIFSNITISAKGDGSYLIEVLPDGVPNTISLWP